MVDNSLSKLRGDASVAIAMAALLEQNLVVSEPRSDAAPYDLLVDVDGKFWRLQIRRAYQDSSGVLVANVRKTSMRAKSCHVAKYDASQIDFLIAVDKNDCYVFPISEIIKRKATIALKNKEHFKNNWTVLR